MRNVEILNHEAEGSERDVVVLENGTNELNHPMRTIHFVAPGRSQTFCVGAGGSLSVSDSMPKLVAVAEAIEEDGPSAPDTSEQQVELDEIEGMFHGAGYFRGTDETISAFVSRALCGIDAYGASLRAVIDGAAPAEDHAVRDETPVTEDGEASLAFDGLGGAPVEGPPVVDAPTEAPEGEVDLGPIPADGIEPNADPIDGQSDIEAGVPYTGGIVQ